MRRHPIRDYWRDNIKGKWPSKTLTIQIRYKLVEEAQALPVGSNVEMIIDENTRNIHAKIHSAGHILDLAVQRLSKQIMT